MMGKPNMMERMILRFPWGAAIAYGALVLLLIGGTWNAIADVLGRRAEVAAAREILEGLEGRGRPIGNVDNTAGVVPPGSPTLEGPTLTVAGASLLQRVTGAVTKLGGNVLSSQVELQGFQTKADFVGVITNCELDQSSLQELLYDLEAGMPYLFIDRLVVQAPVAASIDRDARMHIQLAVSGRWQGSK